MTKLMDKDTLKSLKTADVAAFKAGQSSNFITNYVRRELIKAAHDLSKKLNKEVTAEIDMTTASYVVPSIALLSRSGNYPALFSNCKMEFNEGNIVLTYTIASDSLSAEYKEKLNKEMNLAIA